MIAGIENFAETAHLFGWLLVRELDTPLLVRLHRKPVSDAFAAIGIQVPHEDLDHLHAEYYACFLAPQDSVPLVQSLWEGGSYDGPATARLRKLGEGLGLKLDSGVCRGAPVDHLGSILQLWSRLAANWPEHAADLARHHLSWAQAPLAKVAGRSSFYGQLALATGDLIDQIQQLSPVDDA